MLPALFSFLFSGGREACSKPFRVPPFLPRRPSSCILSCARADSSNAVKVRVAITSLEGASAVSAASGAEGIFECPPAAQKIILILARVGKRKTPCAHHGARASERDRFRSTRAWSAECPLFSTRQTPYVVYLGYLAFRSPCTLLFPRHCAQAQHTTPLIYLLSISPNGSGSGNTQSAIHRSIVSRSPVCVYVYTYVFCARA